MSLASDAGSASVRIVPDATGFGKKTQAQLKGERADFTITPDADTKKFSAQVKLAKELAEKDAVNIKVRVDDSSLRRARVELKKIEHTYSQSPLKKALRLNVAVVGAAALPQLALAAGSAASAITGLGQAALALPGLMSGALAVVGTLATGLSGLTDAFKAASVSTAEAASASKAHTSAVKDEQRAQRDVARARRDALRELQDLNLELKGAALSEADARLAVQQSLRDYNKGGFKDGLDRQEAYLRYLQSVQRYQETVVGNQRKATDALEANYKGVDGSDNVIEALDRLAKAQEAAGEAAKKASGMGADFEAAMAKLSPAAQDFVLKLKSMSGAWQQLQQAVSTKLLDGVADKIQDLATNRLPLLQAGMERVASGLNSNFKQVLDTLGKDRNADSIAQIFESTAVALTRANPGLDSFVSSFLKLSEVGATFLPRLSDAFNKLMGRFDTFITTAANDGSLEKWIDNGLDTISNLGSALENILKIFGSITKAYETATGNFTGLAGSLDRGTEKLANFLNSAEGQQNLIKYFQDAKGFIEGISDALKDVPKIFQALSEGARAWSEVLFPILGTVGRFLSEHLGTVKILLGAYLAFRTASAVLGTLGATWRGIERSTARVQGGYDRLINGSAAFQEKLRAEQSASGGLAAARLNQESAEKRLATARDNVTQAEKNYQTASAQSSRMSSANSARIQAADRARVTASNELVAAQNNLKTATKGVVGETKNAATATSNLIGSSGAGLRGLTAVSGQGGATGAVKGLAKVLGGLAAGIMGGAASLGITVGIVYALNELANAHERAGRQAEFQNNMESALKNTLDAGTGAATGASQRQQLETLQNYKNPYDGSDFNALDLADKRLGIKPAETRNLIQPTQRDAREARLAPTDAAIAKAVPEIDEWKRWGDKFKKNGVDESTYGKALNGDPDSIAKVEAARHAIADEGIGIPFGLGVMQGSVPQDLGTAQQELSPENREKSLAAGALRSSGNTAVQAGDANKQLNEGSTGGLTDTGHRNFDSFGVNSVAINPDGSGSIALDTRPDDAWIKGALERGIRVTDRPGTDGVNIVLDESAVARNLLPKFAGGGKVQGAGSGTSDSIPAYLSNGEYVLSDRAVRSMGGLGPVDEMHKRAIRGFSGGGSPWWGPGPVVPKPIAPLPLPGDLLNQAGAALDAQKRLGQEMPGGRGPTIGGGPGSDLMAASRTGINGRPPAVTKPGLDAQFPGLNSNPGVLGVSTNLRPNLGYDPGIRAGFPAVPPMAAPVTPKPIAPPAIPAKTAAAPAKVPGLFSPENMNPGLTNPGAPTSTPTPKAPASAPIIGTTGTGTGKAPGPVSNGVPVQYGGPQVPARGYQNTTPVYKSSIPGSVAANLSSFADQADQLPYIWGGFSNGGFDCSGLAAAMANIATGQDPFSGGRFSTLNQGEELAKRGFLAGDGGPGTLTIGWSDTHTGITLPDGRHIDAQNQDNGIVLGEGSPGATGFANVMHLPVAGLDGGIAGGGMYPGGMPIGAGGLPLPGQPGGPGMGMPLGGGITMNSDGTFGGPYGPLPVNLGELAKTFGGIGLQFLSGFTGIDFGKIGDIFGKVTDGIEGMGSGAGGDPGTQQLLDGYASNFNSPVPFLDGGAGGISYSAGGGAEQWRPVVREMLQTYGPQVGITNYKLWEDRLVRQINSESSGNPGAENPNDSNGQGGSQSVSGLLQFLPSTFSANNITGGDYKDPVAQIAAAIPYVFNKYGEDAQGGPNQIGNGVGYATGGPVWGAGTRTSDSIPAYLSNGEYVLSASAVKGLGGMGTVDQMHQRARGFAGGGGIIIPPTTPLIGGAGTATPPPAAQLPLGPPPLAAGAPDPANPSAIGGPTPDQGAPGTPEDPNATPDATDNVPGIPGIPGGTPEGQPAAGENQPEEQQDPRSILGAAPVSNNHLNPGLKQGIEGAFNQAGALGAQAASAAASAGTLGAGGAAGGAAGSFIQGGAQIAGQVASGAANVLASLAVGSLSPGTSPSGSGNALLAPSPGPAQPSGGSGPGFQVNGNVYTNNLDEFSKMQDRKQAQAAGSYLNRMP